MVSHGELLGTDGSMMTSAPEQRARKLIDAQLAVAGWVVHDRDEMNLGAALGVAVREYPMTAGPCSIVH